MADTLVIASAAPVSAARPKHPRTLLAARAIAEALFCTDAAPAPAHRIEWLMAELDSVLTAAGWRSGGFYRFAVLLVSLLAPLMIGRPVPLRKLPLPQRVRALRRMEIGFAASLVIAVKAVLCLVYYEHPEAVRETGYAPGSHRVAS